MEHQFNISPFTTGLSPAADTLSSVADLLRQILSVQRDHLDHDRQLAAAQDNRTRWRSLLNRWKKDYPELPEDCLEALPILERAYGSLISQMVQELHREGPEALDNEFSLQDFLDRYGMRLGQMGNILSLVGPLAEAASQSEATP